MSMDLTPERIATLRRYVDECRNLFTLDVGREKYQHVETLDALLAERSRNTPIVEAAERWAEQWDLSHVLVRPEGEPARALYEAVTAAGKGGG